MGDVCNPMNNRMPPPPPPLFILAALYGKTRALALEVNTITQRFDFYHLSMRIGAAVKVSSLSLALSRSLSPFSPR